MGIETPLLRSSEMKLSGEKTERLVSICRELGATHYLSGESGSDYISQEDFSNQGIELEYQNYEHPVYPQRYPGFVPHLSTIDLLFNCGEQSLSILKQDKTEPIRCSYEFYFDGFQSSTENPAAYIFVSSVLSGAAICPATGSGFFRGDLSLQPALRHVPLSGNH